VEEANREESSWCSEVRFPLDEMRLAMITAARRPVEERGVCCQIAGGPGTAAV